MFLYISEAVRFRNHDAGEYILPGTTISESDAEVATQDAKRPRPGFPFGTNFSGLMSPAKRRRFPKT